MNYVRDFADLPKNWDSYGAEPIEPKVIKAALSLEELLTTRPWPAPGADGSISFEWHSGEDTLIVGIKLDGPQRLVFDFYARLDGRDYEKEAITDDV